MTTETETTDNKPSTHSETVRELFSDQKASFIEALECLYVPNNQGGRLMFAEQWPAAAEKIFSDELIQYDHEGVKTDEDRERRAELEEQSNEQREAMLEIFKDLETRLVVYGSLQVEELGKIMQKIDRPIAEYVFAERFVGRYFPDESKADQNNQPEDKTQGATRSESEISGVQEAAEQQNGNDSDQETKTAQSSDDGHSTPHKEVVEVPDDTQAGHSIGHVDHSFSTSAPQYKEGEEGEDNEDMKWLDMEDDDEFAGVQPISTEVTPPDPGVVNEHMPQDDVSAPKEMSLKEYQANHEHDEPEESLRKDETKPDGNVSGAGADEPPRQEPQAVPGGEQEHRANEEPQGDSIPADPSSHDEPSQESARRPMGMAGLRTAQEENRSQEMPPAQEERPDASQSENAESPVRKPMGMGGVGQQHQQGVQQETPAPKSEDDKKKPESEESPSKQEEKKEEKPAPRVPSLDDIDKHMSNSGTGGNAPDGFPPIPGSEDD